MATVDTNFARSIPGLYGRNGHALASLERGRVPASRLPAHAVTAR